VPKILRTADPVRAEAMMRAVRKMIKLDIAKLKQAYDESAPALR